MAEVDNVVYDELAFRGTMVRSFRCMATGATSTISSKTHKFGNTINTVFIKEEGTTIATFTRSGTDITVTCPNDTYLNVVITGR